MCTAPCAHSTPGRCQPPTSAARPSASAGPQVPGSYSCTGVDVAEDRLDDRPGRLDASWRANSVASPAMRVAEQPLVGVHLVAVRAGATTCSSVGSDDHLLAGLLDARADARSSRRGSGGSGRSCVSLGDELAERRPLERRPAPRSSSTGRHLPARMKNGTPSQRHESMCSRTAAKVSTVESGATPGSCAVAAELAAHEVARVERADRRGTPSPARRGSTRGRSSTGGSIARKPTTCSRWFWTTSRIAPASS